MAMNSIYAFLKTILDFLVQIVMLFIDMFVYVLHFLGGLIQSLANSV
jgi:hypothetical protein